MPMKVRYTVVDGEVFSENRGGVERDYVPDPLGSTVALLDSTQAITDTLGYWPYGEQSSRTGTTQTPFQYIGTLGYYTGSITYVRARVLDELNGRWLTEDNFSGVGKNKYLYAAASPLNYYDPEGYSPYARASQPKCNCSKVLSEAKKLIGMKCGNAHLSKGITCIDVWGTATLKAGCGFEKVPADCPLCHRHGVSHVHSIKKACDALQSSGHWQSPCNTQTIQAGCLITFSIQGADDLGCGAHSAIMSSATTVIMCSKTCPGASEQQPKICERSISEWIDLQGSVDGNANATIKGCGCFCKKWK